MLTGYPCPSGSGWRYEVYLEPLNWIVAAGSLARTSVSAPKRSRNDNVRFATSCWIESTANPANDPSAFFSAAGLVRNTSPRVLLVVPGNRSPASPRLEQPENIDEDGQKFPWTGAASRFPNASAWTTASPRIDPVLLSLLK